MIQLKSKNSGSIALTQKIMKGDDGGYYIPSVDSEGNLTWTPTGEDMESVEAVNIRGKDGLPGPAGKDGTVSFEELTPEQVESLRGPIGPEGPQGPQGNDYTLTEDDKIEIAQLVMDGIPQAEEGKF